MTQYEKVEKYVCWTVAKPLSLAVYGLWLGGKYLAAAARRGCHWAGRRKPEPLPRA
jgi:hypothetical protein